MWQKVTDFQDYESQKQRFIRVTYPTGKIESCKVWNDINRDFNEYTIAEPRQYPCLVRFSVETVDCGLAGSTDVFYAKFRYKDEILSALNEMHKLLEWVDG